jgi:sporulation protein YlmC with PRC-barrel domain
MKGASMKAANCKCIILSTATLLAATLAWGNDQASQQQSQTSGQASSGSEIRFSKLKDATVTSSAGESLGKVEDLLINPTSGKIEFVILGNGGFLGMGEKRIPVPWQAVNVQSEKQFTLNVDKNKLKSAPTLSKNYPELASPDYTVTIYRFYEIPLGGAEGLGGSQQGPGQSSGNQDSSSGSSSSQPNQQ